jgi:hypothetical protein
MVRDAELAPHDLHHAPAGPKIGRGAGNWSTMQADLAQLPPLGCAEFQFWASVPLGVASLLAVFTARFPDRPQ